MQVYTSCKSPLFAKQRGAGGEFVGKNKVIME
jgi:hypothetical protein